MPRLFYSLIHCTDVPWTLFFPALLGRNWCITLCKFKAYSLVIWYTYVLCDDYTNLVNVSITLQGDVVCVCLMSTFKICALSNFQVYNVALLTIASMLYMRSPELTRLRTGSLYSLAIFTHFLHSLASDNHQSARCFNEFCCFRFPDVGEIIQYVSVSDFLHLV